MEKIELGEKGDKSDGFKEDFLIASHDSSLISQITLFTSAIAIIFAILRV